MEELIIPIFIGILLILTIIVLIICITKKDWEGTFTLILFASILIISEIFIISDIQNDKTESTAIESKITNTQPEPSALDVYRGLTELEITSVNGVPKDSVVVFKK